MIESEAFPYKTARSKPNVNPLSANPTKCSNSRRIIWVCLTILWVGAERIKISRIGNTKLTYRKDVLPLFFWKLKWSIRTSYKEALTNYTNVHIHTFLKRLSFIWGWVFHVSSLKMNVFIVYYMGSKWHEKHLPNILFDEQKRAWNI